MLIIELTIIKKEENLENFYVLLTSGKAIIKSCAFAIVAASITSWSVAVSLPNKMFSRIVP